MTESKDKQNRSGKPQSDKPRGKRLSGNTQGGKTSGKSDGKKPGFNFYWIYAILAVVFIGLQFFNWGSTAVEISQMRFENEMLVWDEEDGSDIAQLKIVNKEEVEEYVSDILDLLP
ncbi:MAG: hypothetical protein ACLFN2_06300, partial [Bacteroidales bacterium]